MDLTLKDRPEAANSDIIFAVQSADGSGWLQLSYARLIAWIFQSVVISAVKYAVTLSAENFVEDGEIYSATVTHGLGSENILTSLWFADGMRFPDANIQKISQNQVKVWISQLSDAIITGHVTAVL